MQLRAESWVYSAIQRAVLSYLFQAFTKQQMSAAEPMITAGTSYHSLILSTTTLMPDHTPSVIANVIMISTNVWW